MNTATTKTAPVYINADQAIQIFFSAKYMAELQRICSYYATRTGMNSTNPYYDNVLSLAMEATMSSVMDGKVNLTRADILTYFKKVAHDKAIDMALKSGAKIRGKVVTSSYNNTLDDEGNEFISRLADKGSLSADHIIANAEANAIVEKNCQTIQQVMEDILSPSEWLIVQAYYFENDGEGMKLREIAELLDLPLNTVKGTHSRIKDKLASSTLLQSMR